MADIYNYLPALHVLFFLLASTGISASHSFCLKGWHKFPPLLKVPYRIHKPTVSVFRFTLIVFIYVHWGWCGGKFSAHRGQKKESDAVELELQVEPPVGTGSWSGFLWTVHALNHWAIHLSSPTPALLPTHSFWKEIRGQLDQGKWIYCNVAPLGKEWALVFLHLFLSTVSVLQERLNKVGTTHMFTEVVRTVKSFPPLAGSGASALPVPQTGRPGDFFNSLGSIISIVW